MAALVAHGFALAASMAAAAVSGFVAPRLLREIIDAAPPARQGWEILLDDNDRINQTP